MALKCIYKSQKNENAFKPKISLKMVSLPFFYCITLNKIALIV